MEAKQNWNSSDVLTLREKTELRGWISKNRKDEWDGGEKRTRKRMNNRSKATGCEWNEHVYRPSCQLSSTQTTKNKEFICTSSIRSSVCPLKVLSARIHLSLASSSAPTYVHSFSNLSNWRADDLQFCSLLGCSEEGLSSGLLPLKWRYL